MKKAKKTFDPKVEIYTPFQKPFSKPADKVVSANTDQAAACCACTACTACR